MNIPSELAKAESLITNGKLEEAKAVLRGVLAEDKRNAQAWYLVSQSVDEPRAKAEALRRTLLSDPDHAKAKREFLAMNGMAILKPPSMTAVKAVTPTPVAVQRASPPLHLLVGGAVAVIVVLAVIIVLVANRPGVSLPAASLPTVPNTAAATIVANTVSNPTANSVAATMSPTKSANDPLAATATALVQQMTSTTQSLLNVAQGQTQVAQLTQTATQQGALGATVAAQQTSIAAMNALPGTLLFSSTNPGNPVSPKIRFVTNAGSLTADGQHTTYTKDNRIDGDWYVANLDGTNPRKVLSGGQHYGQMIWSADGQQLALIGVRLAVVSPDRTEPKFLTADTMNVTQAVWSPDSQRLAFFATTQLPTGNRQTGVYVVASNGTGSVQTLVPPNNARLSFLQWFPDGQQLLYYEVLHTANTITYTLKSTKLDGSSPRVIAEVPPQAAPLGLIALSPNGKWSSFVGEDDNLYLVDMSNGVIHKVVTVGNASTSLRDPVWSPNGNYLAGNNKAQSVKGQLYWVDAEKAEVHPIVLNTDYYMPLPLWSPDSQAILSCHSESNANVITGQVLLIPLANSTPVALLDKPVCPARWLP